jgi:hypothetical protein
MMRERRDRIALRLDGVDSNDVDGFDPHTRSRPDRPEA